jgi:tripartite-type tricarboxylate transporter receptor subunit TctC
LESASCLRAAASARPEPVKGVSLGNNRQVIENNDEVKKFSKALESPDLKERLLRLAAEPAALSPNQFKQFVPDEQSKYAAVIRASGAPID